MTSLKIGELDTSNLVLNLKSYVVCCYVTFQNDPHRLLLYVGVGERNCNVGTILRQDGASWVKNGVSYCSCICYC